MSNLTDLQPDTRTRIVATICSIANPMKIILFGSQARGNANPDSDYDLLVVVSDDTHSCLAESGKLISALTHSGISADVMVKRHSLYNAVKAATVGFWGAIKQEGVVLYECR